MLILDMMLTLSFQKRKKKLGIEGKDLKATPFLLTKSSHPFQPRKSCLIYFHGITSERHLDDSVGQAGDSGSALLVLPCLRGPFSVLVYTSAKGVELILLFTGKFQGMISFQEVLQDPR
ncbi:unnamed protein product [Rangifer tarandus platyrhynchus]|uniref:Uncharacterized protein n=2 Tax=Rangifer tarandus platyrhynchus TaxID=3082113 RepID=A0AC59Z8A8_RANTA|nr:unnamed protein product [Rangifer tarandus platyrhynchus]